MSGVLVRRRKLTKTQTEGRRACEDRARGWGDVGTKTARLLEVSRS
jgi:hypothetical protein